VCGWWAWTCDGFDYFAVSVTLTELGKEFGKTDSQMSFAITLTLLFRSLGALIFGVLADRFGRRWTLTANMLIIAALQLGSGFVTNYSQFLGVRSVFGIAMGGVWGQAAATALENVPAASRGFFSGIVQQGYTIGYLLAAVINMTVGQYSAPKWRSLYFIGAGFSAASALFRAALPESQQFLRAREEQKAAGVSLSGGEAARHFFREIGHMLRSNWIRCIWAICVRPPRSTSDARS
jgi:SHS family lactate transporter-like MFS transporter